MEKFSPRYDLEIVRRFIVEDIAFMGEINIDGTAIEVYDMLVVHVIFFCCNLIVIE